MLNLHVFIDNRILQLQVLQCLKHLLDLAADLSSARVFKIVDCLSDSLEVLRQVQVNMLLAPVTVAGEEFRHLSHVLNARLLVVFPYLFLLCDDQSEQVLEQTLKLGQFKNQAHQLLAICDLLHKLAEDFILAVEMQHDPPDCSVGLP